MTGRGGATAAPGKDERNGESEIGIGEVLAFLHPLPPVVRVSSRIPNDAPAKTPARTEFGRFHGMCVGIKTWGFRRLYVKKIYANCVFCVCNMCVYVCVSRVGEKREGRTNEPQFSGPTVAFRTNTPEHGIFVPNGFSIETIFFLNNRFLFP